MSKKPSDLEKKLDKELADIEAGKVTLSESPLGDTGDDHMERLRASAAPMGSLRELKCSMVDKDTLKHCKDCLKMLNHPGMSDLVANYDVIIHRYRDLVDLFTKGEIK